MRANSERMLMRLPSQSGYFGFRVIGFFKLATGLLAVVMGFAFVRFVQPRPGAIDRANQRPFRPRSP